MSGYSITSDVRPVGAWSIVRPLLRRPVHAMPLQDSHGTMDTSSRANGYL